METRGVWRLWWSGVFALAAFAHLVRAVAGIPVTFGTMAIPMWVSWLVFPIAGVISGWLMRIALEATERIPPRPSTMGPGGFHPTSIGKEEPQHAGQTYCGIQVGYHAVGEDDEPE